MSCDKKTEAPPCKHRGDPCLGGGCRLQLEPESARSPSGRGTRIGNKSGEGSCRGKRRSVGWHSRNRYPLRENCAAARLSECGRFEPSSYPAEKLRLRDSTKAQRFLHSGAPH